jgi:hypothetical protein
MFGSDSPSGGGADATGQDADKISTADESSKFVQSPLAPKSPVVGQRQQEQDAAGEHSCE